MRELGVDGYADDLHTARFEFLDAAVVRQDFGGADEGEVERVEEHHNVLAGVVGQGKIFFDGTVGHYGRGGETGSFLANECSHGGLLLKGGFWLQKGTATMPAAEVVCKGAAARLAAANAG
jgi:hypothetical protein